MFLKKELHIEGHPVPVIAKIYCLHWRKTAVTAQLNEFWNTADQPYWISATSILYNGCFPNLIFINMN